MKVTQVVNDDFPSDGGYQTLVTDIVRHMANREEVTSEVICLSSDQKEYNSSQIQTILTSPNKNKLSIIFTILYNWIILTRYILKSEPDVIHAHQTFISGVYCWPTKLFQTKLICTSHGKDILLDRKRSYGSRQKIHRRVLIYITLKLVDKHIIVSESMKASAISAGSSTTKIRVIHNGIDMGGIPNDIKEPTILDPSHFNILFIGRQISVKRPELLIQALNIIPDKNGIRLHYAGRGPMENKLIQLTRELELSRSVTFHGYLNEDPKWKMLSQADLVVLPSDTEAFGLVLIEAMACETPVMAPDHGPFPEIISNLEDGILYNKNTPGSLARGISIIRDNPCLQAYLGKNAKKTVEKKFTIQRCVEEHYSLYNEPIPES